MKRLRMRIFAATISITMLLTSWQAAAELWEPPSEPPEESGPVTALGLSSSPYVPSSQTILNGTQTEGDCGSTWSALNSSDDSRCSYREVDVDPSNQTGVVIIPDATDVNGWSIGKTCSQDATPWDELDDGADTNDGDATCREGDTNGNRVGTTLSDPSWMKAADIDDFTVVSSSVVKKTGSKAASISVDVKVGASSYNSGSTQATTTSYVRYSRTDNVNPVSAAEWTASDINNLAVATRCVDCSPDNRVTQMQAKVDAFYNPDYALEVRFGWSGVPLTGDSWTLVVECTRLVPGAENLLVQIGQGGNPPTSWSTAYTCISDGDQSFRTYKLSAAELNNGAPVVRLWDAFADEPDDTVRGTVSIDVLRIDRLEYKTGQSPWFYYVGGYVNADNGNLFLPFRDLTVKALGWPLEIVRAYNSGLADIDGLMDHGWTFTYDTRMVEATAGIANWYAPDGGVHTYRLSGGSWIAPPGIDAKLTKSTTFTLWFKDGSKFNFNSVGRLSTMVDKNGNTITLTWSQFAPIELLSVADDSGLQLTFLYQVSGPVARITMIQFPEGRQVRYWYDANGNMYAFKDAMGSYSYYTYDGYHRVLTWRDPVESPMPLPVPYVRKTTFRYDAWGRIDQIKLASVNAQTNATQYEYVSYELDYVSAVFPGADHAVNATNARNIVATIDMDTSGIPLRVKGPQCGMCFAIDGGRGGGTTGCGGGGCGCSGGCGGSCSGSGEVTEELTFTWDSNRDLLTKKDKGNHQYAYTYDSRRNLLNVTDPSGNVTRNLWSNVDNGTTFISTLNRTTNARGFTWYNEYDWKGNLKQVKDPTNNVTKMEYDAHGYATKTTDWRGYNTTYGYNSHGYLVNRTDATLNRTQFTVDGAGRTTHTMMPDGDTWHTEYDANDRVTKVTDPLGNFTAYAFNARNDMTSVRNPRGYTTLYSWNVTNFKMAATTDALGNTTSYGYDSVGNLVKITNARGFSTVFVYDDFNRRTIQRDARGNETVFTHDGDGLITAVRNRRGFYTNYTYDSLHRQMMMTDALGNLTTIYYDQVGNVVMIRNARGYEMTFTYDKLNRKTMATDALGNYTTFVYDANGNSIASSDPNGESQTIFYDAVNRPTSVKNGMGYISNTTYDSEGNVLQVEDAEGNVVSYVYDALNRHTESTDGAGGTTLFSYDAVGNLLNVTDGNGNVTRRQFDALNRMTRETSPLGKVTVLAYDANGNDASWTDPMGHRINYTYDELDRLTKISYPNGQNLTSTYDAEGNRLTATGFGFTRTKVYDALNRVTSVTMDYGSFSKQVQYTYDEVSNRKTMTYPEDQTITYTYDALNRLTTLQDSVAGAWNFTYDAGSRRTRLVYPSGLKTEYAYNADSWLMGVYTNTSGGSVMQSFVYTYDKAGNRKTVTENGGNVSTYVYDDAYRLASESYTGGLTINYTYDDAGNRLTERRNGIQTNYTYDADNRMTSKGTATYSYDDNGNLISVSDGGEWTNYTWTYGNLLASAVLPDGTTTSYEYTTDRKVLSRMESTVTTWYAYDFAEVNGDYDIVVEYNSTGAIQTRYVHGAGTNEPLAVVCGETMKLYLLDALGSVTGLATGQILQSAYNYEGFGAPRMWSGPLERYGFLSWDADALLDQYSHKARWYDAKTGRFSSKNLERSSVRTDLYLYADNNPVGHVWLSKFTAWAMSYRIPFVILGRDYWPPVMDGGAGGDPCLNDCLICVAKFCEGCSPQTWNEGCYLYATLCASYCVQWKEVWCCGYRWR